jgi:aconitate hydratase
MATKKKRLAGRAVKKRAARKRVAAKRAAPKRRSSATPRRATGLQSTRKNRASKGAAVQRKERKVDKARQQLIGAERELAVEVLPKAVHPATKKRGADSHVPSTTKRKRPSYPKEQKLEQGLEESMAGSDPVSVTQPTMPIAEKPENNAEPRDDD